jgi:hypothetical protein
VTDFVKFDLPAQHFRHRRDAAAVNAARHDTGTRRKIDRDVQRKAVQGHPTRDLHAHRRDFG